jgi:hypothetical protein
MLGKMLSTKKAHEKNLTSKSQSLMAGPNCQAGWGKMVQPRLWARHGFYRRGRLRKLAHVRESPVGAELVLEHGNFCLSVVLLLGMAPFLK